MTGRPTQELEAETRAAELRRLWAEALIARGDAGDARDLAGDAAGIRLRQELNVRNTSNRLRVRALQGKRTTPAERIELELREGILAA